MILKGVCADSHVACCCLPTQAGHALVGALMPEYDPVTKISIVPRGAAGGLTFFAPSEERLESGLYSRTYLENQVRMSKGWSSVWILAFSGGGPSGSPSHGMASSYCRLFCAVELAYQTCKPRTSAHLTTCLPPCFCRWLWRWAAALLRS